MKKSMFALAFACLFASASCEKKTETTIESKDTTVVVTPPPPAVDTVMIKDSAGTSVQVGKEGVDVDTKGTDVEVKNGNAKVEVKK